MNYRFLLIFLVMIMSVTSVYSASPHIQETIYTNSPQLEIIYPKFESFPSGQNLNLHFHIFNSSGYIMKNDTTSCVFHLYNQTGHHVLERNLSFDSNGIDFYVQINTSILDQKDYYSYIVQCESDQEAGYLSTDFLISSGFERYNERIIAFVLAVCFLSFFFLYFAFNLDKDHFLIKLLAVFFSLSNLILIPTVFISGLESTARIFFNIPLSFVVLFAIYFFVYISWYYLNKLKDSIK